MPSRHLLTKRYLPSPCSTIEPGTNKTNPLQQAAKWHQIISICAGLTTNESPLQSPISPTASGAAPGAATPPSYSRTGTQELGVTIAGTNGAGSAPARSEISGVPIVAAGDVKRP